MKKNLKIFWLFSHYSIKTALQNPLGLVLFTGGKLIRFGMFFMFVYYLLFNTKILSGYNIHQTIIFFLTYNLIDTIAQLLFREVYRFRPLIVSAEFDSILVKPYHPFLRILIGGVDLLDMFVAVLYIALLTYFVMQLGPLSGLQIFSYIGLIINSLVLALSFHIAVLALAIITTEVDHTIMIYRDMTKMGSFPIDIYAEPVRSIFTFVIPVGVMMTVPVKGLLGLLSVEWYIGSVALAIISLFLSLKLWDHAIKKYQSWGG